MTDPDTVRSRNTTLQESTAIPKTENSEEYPSPSAALPLRWGLLEPRRRLRAWFCHYELWPEPVKIELPYQRKVHVLDIKKMTMRGFDNGSLDWPRFEDLKLLTFFPGWLRQDMVWDDEYWKFKSSYDHPILSVKTGQALGE
ncbi:hypothetical protein BGX26_011361 [Mortierella sp. AD094]|nr:hypothetical protein BGX26_011361 [Mortierella sp. AD094]